MIYRAVKWLGLVVSVIASASLLRRSYEYSCRGNCQVRVADTRVGPATRNAGATATS